MRRIYSVIILLLALYAAPLWACAPYMHTYLAKLWLDTQNVIEKNDRKEFVLGALFPDIRYLGKVKRNQTHAKHVTLKEIQQEKDYFTKGMLFHAFVDQQHLKFVQNSQAYSNLPKDIKGSRKLLIELIEDQLLYQSKWADTVQAMLSEPSAKEKKFGLTNIDIYQWHFILGIYFSEPPAGLFQKMALLHNDVWFLDKETIQSWRAQLSTIHQKTYYQNYVDALVSFFERQFTQVH